MKKIIIFMILAFSFLILNAENVIKKVEFKGNINFSKKELLSQISHQEKKGFLFWKKYSSLDPELLIQDTEQLVKFYQREGFLNPKIGAKTKNYNEKETDLIITINEGDFFKIKEVTFINIDISLQNLINKDSVNFSLQKNKRFRDNDLFKTKKQISQLLSNNGFPFSNIEYFLEIDEELKNVRITFDIETKGLHKFGNHTISGNIKTPSYYLEKEVNFAYNQAFDQRKLSQTQQQLMDLGVFQYATIKIAKDNINDKKIPIEILVEETERLNVKFGFGYGLEDQFRVSGNIEKLGFFRSIDKLDLFAKHSGLEPYHIKIKLTEPYILTKKNKIITSLFAKKQEAPAYTIRRYGGTTKFQRQFNKFLSGFTGFTYERNFLDADETITDEIEDSDKYNKANILLGMNISRTTPAISPHKGFTLSTIATFAGIGFNSDFHYHQYLVEFKKFFPISKRTTLATKFKIGIMQTTLNDEFTPVEERFYSGGSNSNRGWSYADLGPKSSNNPIGGNSLLENSVELRFPIWKMISGVLFTHFGNVWSDSYKYDLTNIRFGNGTGIRITTPIGPIRFDLALSDKLDFQYFLSIGEAF